MNFDDVNAELTKAGLHYNVTSRNWSASIFDWLVLYEKRASLSDQTTTIEQITDLNDLRAHLLTQLESVEANIQRRLSVIRNGIHSIGEKN